MSAMADLDIELSQFKLSDAQKNAVVEVFDKGYTTAKANTIKSLENKGLIVKVSETHHKLGTVLDDFLSEWQGAASEESFTHIIDGDGVLKKTDGTTFDTYQADWQAWEKELAGFGETLKWKNTKVWEGLTASQIAKDIATARPINRQARRQGVKMMRRLIAAL